MIVLEKRYSIRFKPSAERQLKDLPEKERIRIARKIGDLAADPRLFGSEKLAGEESLYRIRSGDYRVIYQIQDKFLMILVVKIGHRKEIYR